MSASPVHDSLFRPFADYLRSNEKARVVLYEPGRPMSWPRTLPWPAVDIFAFGVKSYDTIAIDVKRTASDLNAQTHKAYVGEGDRYGVGNRRYVAIPVSLHDELNGRVTTPDGWGLLMVDDAGVVVELSEPHQFKWERNWPAEQHLAVMELVKNLGGAVKPNKRPSVHAGRKLADAAVDAMSSVPCSLGMLAKEIGTTPLKLEKVLRHDERIETEVVFGKTQVRLAESATA